jgi:hypothetical protein
VLSWENLGKPIPQTGVFIVGDYPDPTMALVVGSGQCSPGKLRGWVEIHNNYSDPDDWLNVTFEIECSNRPNLFLRGCLNADSR